MSSSTGSRRSRQRTRCSRPRRDQGVLGHVPHPLLSLPDGAHAQFAANAFLCVPRQEARRTRNAAGACRGRAAAAAKSRAPRRFTRLASCAQGRLITLNLCEGELQNWKKDAPRRRIPLSAVREVRPSGEFGITISFSNGQRDYRLSIETAGLCAIYLSILRAVAARVCMRHDDEYIPPRCVRKGYVEKRSKSGSDWSRRFLSLGAACVLIYRSIECTNVSPQPASPHRSPWPWPDPRPVFTRCFAQAREILGIAIGGVHFAMPFNKAVKSHIYVDLSLVAELWWTKAISLSCCRAESSQMNESVFECLVQSHSIPLLYSLSRASP